MQNKFSKFIKVLLGILAVLCIALVIVVIVHIKSNLPLDTITDQDYDELAKQVQQQQAEGLEKNNSDEVKSETYLYKNHGFEIELPKGFVPQEIQGETGPTTSIELPEGWLIVISDAKWWEKYNMDSLDYVKDQRIGDTTFKVYKSRYAVQSHEAPFYSFWFKQGNVAYLFNGKNGQTGDYGASQLESFKFVGWK